MSKPDITCEADLNLILKSVDKVCILFYASWCPYSIRFLPFFESAAKDRESFARVVIENDESLAEKFGVNFYPTVIYFESGKVSKRLDGVPGRGLTERQLTDFLKGCGL